MVDVVVDGLLASHPEAAGRGLGRYVDSLLTNLPGVPGLDLTALMVGDRPLPPDVRRVDVRRLDPHLRVEWYEHILRIGLDAQRTHADVFHSPGVHPPLWYRGPWVQTLHDVTPLEFPSDGWGVEPFRWRIRGALMRRAAAVICISQHTADMGIRHLGLAPERLHVVYHGVAPVFRESAEPFSTDRPYLLLVSGFGPHKGFAGAFAVADRLADAGWPHELRVVGGFDGEQAARVDRLRRAATHADRIVLEGQIGDADLARRYRGASALLVTTRHEGFGLPTIEAMAAGAPVVAFDNSALGEIVGDGGLLVPDGDVARFAHEVETLLRDDAARVDMIRRGQRRSETFTWDRSAHEHAEIYALVA